MGVAKNTAVKYSKIAYEELLNIGAIKTCDIHQDYYYANMIDNDEIYAMVTANVKKKYGDEVNYKVLHEWIKRILDDAGIDADNCPMCEKLERE